MAEPNTTTNQSNTFLEWMRPFIDDEQKDSKLEDQLDMFKSENLATEAE
jgi:hypothetical protein